MIDIINEFMNHTDIIYHQCLCEWIVNIWLFAAALADVSFPFVIVIYSQ